MRLSPFERTAIKEIVHSIDSKAQIYLYGSRTNNSLKGGDIDLLIFSEKIEFKDKISILMEIKRKIGEQKIDLTLRKNQTVCDEPFITEIMNHAIKL